MSLITTFRQAVFSLREQLVHQFLRLRYRAYTFVILAIFIISLLWLYITSSADSFYLIPYHQFTDETAGFRLENTTETKWHDFGNLIPPKIWQIMLPKDQTKNEPVAAKSLTETASWLAMNTDYTYTLVGGLGAKDFVHRRFGDSIVSRVFDSISNPGMKSDLLRYLILEDEGGIYTDTDTVALRPINQWVPAHLRHRVRLLVGIEFDRRDGGEWADISHWVQFCQWTIAAAPGHPVFRKMVDRILQSVEDMTAKYGLPLEQIKPNSFDVLNSTGPAAWTDVVFEHLQTLDSSLNSTQDLSFMSEPTLWGDVLVLPIDSFGMGQPHSKSTNDGTIPDSALMRHLFKGSWREDK